MHLSKQLQILALFCPTITKIENRNYRRLIIIEEFTSIQKLLRISYQKILPFDPDKLITYFYEFQINKSEFEHLKSVTYKDAVRK